MHSEGSITGTFALPRRIAGLAAACASLLLAGCLSNFYEVPKPFEGKHRNEAMLESILRGAALEVRPAEGLPPAEGIALARVISKTAHKHDIAAVIEDAAESADRLSGTANVSDGIAITGFPPRLFVLDRKKRRLPVPGTATPPQRFALSRNPEVRFAWTLKAADGTVKDTVEMAQPLSGAKPEFTKSERKRIATRTVAWLRAALDRGATSSAQAEARRSKPVILVSPVEGATGDGRVSLTTALAEMLAASGACDVLAASEQANIPKGRTAYRVKGRVRISDGDADSQIVSISWTLSDVVGREIGTVDQQNIVPRGSLDGAWGQTAYAAAQGAREGLLALLDRAAGAAAPVR